MENSAHGFTEGADVPQDNTAPEAKHTITEKDRKAIAQSSREQFGYQPPDHLEAAIFNNAAEWGIQYARQEVAELRKENEALRELLSKCRGLLERYHDSGMQDHRQTQMLIEIQSSLSGTKETE